jgi:hypothetical protein
MVLDIVSRNFPRLNVNVGSWNFRGALHVWFPNLRGNTSSWMFNGPGLDGLGNDVLQVRIKRFRRRSTARQATVIVHGYGARELRVTL